MRKHPYVLTLVGILLHGCGSKPHGAEPTADLAHAISDDVSAKLGEPVELWCFAPLGVGMCEATLLHSHQAMAIEVRDDRSEVSWHLVPPNVTVAPIEARVHARLVELDADQPVDCGARVQAIAIGARLECKLGKGGAAFVTLAAAHKMRIEIDLDASAAAARRDDVTGLDAKSKSLDSAGSGSAENETE